MKEAWIFIVMIVGMWLMIGLMVWSWLKIFQVA
jgi:hypothetical protein